MSANATVALLEEVKSFANQILLELSITLCILILGAIGYPVRKYYKARRLNLNGSTTSSIAGTVGSTRDTQNAAPHDRRRRFTRSLTQADKEGVSTARDGTRLVDRS